MRVKTLSALMACGVMVAVSGYAADKQTGLTGKWATDAVATAVERKTTGGVLDSIIKSGSQVGANAVPNGGNNGFGGNGGGFGGNGGGFGGNGGGFGGGGGGFGGGGNRNGGGFGGREFAAQQFGQQPSFGGNGGGFGDNGNNGTVRSRSGIAVDIDGATVVQEGRSEDGVALIMELKVDKAKITGSVTEVVTKTKTTIDEPGTTDGTKFEFTVWEKKGSVKIAKIYKGELKDPMTIELKRTLVGGNPVKGDPDVLIFHRAQ